MTMPTQAELQELFLLDEATGRLYWRASPSPNTKAGQLAGCQQKSRRRVRLKIRSKQYMAHNIVWVYLYGSIPDGMFVDHIDRDEGNNRPSNLRLATRSQNCQNRVYRSSKNSHAGVYAQDGKWSARIKDGAVVRHLGFFSSIDEAINARRSAAEACGQFHITEKSPSPKEQS